LRLPLLWFVSFALTGQAQLDSPPSKQCDAVVEWKMPRLSVFRVSETKSDLVELKRAARFEVLRKRVVQRRQQMQRRLE
jgi:hypothetical protein